MPLIFSPLSEDILRVSPNYLLPKSAFVLRQLGDPPDLDQKMWDAVCNILTNNHIASKDANSSTGRKDFLGRIFDHIRGTGFTIALFSEDTRPTALANIALELGFAAMCGKPLAIVKSKGAKVPSDLVRTDWIECDIERADEFKNKFQQALDEFAMLAIYEKTMLEVSMLAQRMDCAVAFERIMKIFLLTGDGDCIHQAESVLDRLTEEIREDTRIDDIARQQEEIRAFLAQARKLVQQG